MYVGEAQYVINKSGKNKANWSFGNFFNLGWLNAWLFGTVKFNYGLRQWKRFCPDVLNQNTRMSTSSLIVWSRSWRSLHELSNRVLNICKSLEEILSESVILADAHRWRLAGQKGFYCTTHSQWLWSKNWHAHKQRNNSVKMFKVEGFLGYKCMMKDASEELKCWEFWEEVFLSTMDISCQTFGSMLLVDCISSASSQWQGGLG